MVMDFLAQIAKGLFLDLEAGLHQLLIELVLHRFLLARVLPPAIVDIRKHEYKKDAEEQQYEDNCENGGGYLLLCIWHNRIAPQ